MAATDLPEEAATRAVDALRTTPNLQRKLAVSALFCALALSVLAVVWSDNDPGNVLAEIAGVLLSIAVALLLVDVLARRDRSHRYAELTWVAAQTALDPMEDMARRIAHACRRADALSSITLYYRAGDPGDESERTPNPDSGGPGRRTRASFTWSNWARQKRSSKPMRREPAHRRGTRPSFSTRSQRSRPTLNALSA